MQEVSVSLIIPAREPDEKFFQCLSAAASLRPAPDEIIVSMDSRDAPRGPAAARNQGAREARGQVLFFLDADCVPPPDAIARIRRLFEAEPDLTAAFGSYDSSPAAENFLSKYKNLFHHYVHQTSKEEASTFWSGCGVVRREAFFSVGAFRESYHRPSIEDIDLGYRLKQAGHRIRLCKSLQVKHLKRWDFFSLLKADFLDRAVPWSELMLRSGRWVNDLNTRFSARASVVLAWVAVLSAVLLVWSPLFSLPLAAGLLGLAALSASLFRFFQLRQGTRFALWATAWHGFYCFYSGLGFVIGAGRVLARGAAREEER